MDSNKQPVDFTNIPGLPGVEPNGPDKPEKDADALAIRAQVEPVAVDFDHPRGLTDQQMADAIIDRLSPKAQARILAVAKTLGATRAGRRATQSIIQKDLVKAAVLDRVKKTREKNKQARIISLAERVRDRGGRMLPGMSEDRAALIGSVIEDVLP